MATVTLISATGRLKNKIQISYTMTAPIGEILTSAGLAYGSTNVSGSATLLTAPADTPNYGYGPVQNNIFAGIPNGTWYVWAWALTSVGRFFSQARTVIVSSSGYELSDEGSTIANPLIITGGTEGKDRALFSDSSGLATWKPVGEMFAYGHYIGELYGGGVVVDVWKEGDEEKVLIASTENLNSTNGQYDPTGDFFCQWILGNTGAFPNIGFLIGTESSSMYNGAKNTNAIIAVSATAGSAALVCSQYRGGGYEDWYLPSYYELLAIRNQESIISKVLKTDSIDPNDYYWSSTEIKSDSAAAMSSPGDQSNILALRKINGARIRAVRRESFSTGDGVVLSLDATNSKSFSDASYYLSGTASRWSCLVNRGMSSSYSFGLSSAGSSSGGTLTQILTLFTTTGITTEVFSGTVGNWTLSFISSAVPTTPKLYNRTGESSFVSSYFTAAYSDTVIKFDSGDFSYLPGNGVSLNIYVSVQSPGYKSPYALLRQISITTTINSISTYTVPLYQYVGKSISIKITSPGSYWNSTSSFAGPSLDNIYVQGTNGGFQNIGPRYFPDQGGYLKFVSSGGVNGSFINFNAPIGSATAVTVEVWARLAANYSGTMLFGWDQYDVYMAGGHLGYNTNSSDLYGINATKVTSLRIVGNWAHYIFEMRSDVSYTNNKIYINGELQSLSQILAGSGESALRRNFNFGLGRIGGFRGSNNYFFNGDISIFRVYNRALTKEEIMKNYSSGRKRYEIRPSILRDGLYSYIDFNVPASYDADGSVSGNVNDLGEGGRPASLVITATTTKPAVRKTSNQLVLGVKRLIFPGTTTLNPYITWATAGTALQTATDLSVSFWIYFDESRTAEIIVKWASASNGVGPWEVFQSSAVGGSNITFRLISGSTIYQRTGTKVIPNAKWTHVCATYNNSTKVIRTYINSEIDIDYIWPSQMAMDTVTAGDVFVGQYPPSATTNRYPLKGSIYNIQIYTRTIGKEEVKNNYEADKFEFDNAADTNLFFSHELTGNPTFSINQNLTLDIPGKINDRILASDAGGNAVWVDKNSLFDRPTNYRYIGELYGGGIIVGMWKYPSTIWNYLIMSLTDINGAAGSVWSNVSNAATYIGQDPRGGAEFEHKGASNSAAIISQAGHASSAAKLCRDYTGGGFTDWYLPSAQELIMGHNAGQSLGYVMGQDNFAYRGLENLRGIYWSSTEVSTNAAYVLNTINNNFYGGLESGGPINSALKSATYSVRAFRQVRINERRPIWNPEWEWDYVPVEEGWIGWTPWVEENWMPTTVYLDTNPLNTQGSGQTQPLNNNIVQSPGFLTLTFSNTFISYLPVTEAGVCWSTSSVPTISDSYATASSIVGNNFVVKTPPFPYAPAGTNLRQNTSLIFYRAYIKSGGSYYYSSDSGRLNSTFWSTTTTYSVAGQVTNLPTGVYIGWIGYLSLYE